MAPHLRPVRRGDAGAEIQGRVVAERHRGTGVGRALVARAEAWAAERGPGVIRVRSRSTRTGAHEFYGALGYEVVKTSVASRKRL